MEVNNEIYETLGHLWWSEDAGFELTSLRFCMNPVRYGYFQRILGELAIAGRAVLDIGCGGGYLAEPFAADGFQVTGLDPAVNSIRAAQRHAAETGWQSGVNGVVTVSPIGIGAEFRVYGRQSGVGPKNGATGMVPR